MGALTDNRKRCFVEVCFPSPSAAPSAAATTTPATKKQKHSHPSQEGAVKEPISRIEQRPLLPPPAPLRRRVQGPQRIIKVFGLGKPESRPEKETMGNLASRLARTTQLCSIWRGRREKREDLVKEGGEDGRSGVEVVEGMKLDDYRRLVEDFQEEDTRSRGIAFPRTPECAVVGDLGVLLTEEKDEGPANWNIVSRRVEEERTITVDLTPGSEEVRWTRTSTPLYKELLEDTLSKYDSKLSNLGFEVKLAEQEFDRLRSFHKKAEDEEDLEGPFAPLTEEEENVVELALHNPMWHLQRNDILVMHEPSNIEITREMMRCLNHGAWLNDEVINLYLELLKEREKREPKKFLNCHFFNTFFYKKLTGGRGCYDFKAVRRWTTLRKIGYGLIDCDKIFVPIHKEVHWCLAIINVKEKKLQYLDSLGGMDHEVLIVLARYLIDEAKDKNGIEIDAASWKQEVVHGLPLQKNGWDCGMFMLKYVDFYSRGLGLRFDQGDMNYFRRRTVKELLSLRAE